MRNIDLIRGAKVKIVNYGNLHEVRKELIPNIEQFKLEEIILWENKNSFFIDLQPYLIGKEGLIFADKIGKYAIFFDKDKEGNSPVVSYWHNIEQIEYQGTVEVDERMGMFDKHHAEIYGDGTYL